MCVLQPHIDMCNWVSVRSFGEVFEHRLLREMVSSRRQNTDRVFSNNLAGASCIECVPARERSFFSPFRSLNRANVGFVSCIERETQNSNSEGRAAWEKPLNCRRRSKQASRQSKKAKSQKLFLSRCFAALCPLQF